jgi:hypothetical protein
VLIAAAVYMLVFRVIHILAAIAWGGSLFLLVLYLQPTAKAVGPAAGPFMRELLGNRRLGAVLLQLAGTTIVAGGFLYWHDLDEYGGLGEFTKSSFGVWLTIGAVAAISAFLLGVLVTKPTMDRMLAAGARVAQGGDTPPADAVQQVAALQARARSLAKVNLTLVAIAAFAMSTARYW